MVLHRPVEPAGAAAGDSAGDVFPFGQCQPTLAGYGQHGKDVNVSGVSQIVRATASDEPGKYELAATFDVPLFGHGPGWNQLATVFEELT
jgi:hypothetical protein